MASPKSKISGYERDEHDWYLDPEFCTEFLMDKVYFEGPIYDPACGQGNILNVFDSRGYVTTGCDIVDRGWPKMYPTADFLRDDRIHMGLIRNIVCNPPYKLAERFIRRSLAVAHGQIAILTRLDFLGSQKRYDLFQGTNPRPFLVLVLSRRPSMPPGWKDEVKGEGGQQDYCWVCWDATGFNMNTQIRWGK